MVRRCFGWISAEFLLPTKSLQRGCRRLLDYILGRVAERPKFVYIAHPVYKPRVEAGKSLVEHEFVRSVQEFKEKILNSPNMYFSTP